MMDASFITLLTLLYGGVIDPETGDKIKHKWTYDGGTGPKFWSRNYPRCDGAKQSPIDIRSLSAAYDNKLKPFAFIKYPKVSNRFSAKNTIRNHGHTVSLNIADDWFINGGNLDGRYKAVGVDFHWGKSGNKGSEHSLNGQRHDMELHIIHFAEKYGNLAQAIDHPDGLAIIAVFVDTSDVDNPVFDEIISSLSKIHHPGREATIGNFRLPDFMPVDRSVYYQYEGSMTNPPCQENVLWFIMKNPITISKRQINNFFQLKKGQDSGAPLIPSVNIVMNFRPRQELNHRLIKSSKPELRGGLLTNTQNAGVINVWGLSLPSKDQVNADTLSRTKRAINSFRFSLGGTGGVKKNSFSFFSGISPKFQFKAPKPREKNNAQKGKTLPPVSKGKIKQSFSPAIEKITNEMKLKKEPNSLRIGKFLGRGQQRTLTMNKEIKPIPNMKRTHEFLFSASQQNGGPKKSQSPNELLAQQSRHQTSVTNPNQNPQSSITTKVQRPHSSAKTGNSMMNPVSQNTNSHNTWEPPVVDPIPTNHALEPPTNVNPAQGNANQKSIGAIPVNNLNFAIHVNDWMKSRLNKPKSQTHVTPASAAANPPINVNNWVDPAQQTPNAPTVNNWINPVNTEPLWSVPVYSTDPTPIVSRTARSTTPPPQSTANPSGPNAWHSPNINQSLTATGWIDPIPKASSNQPTQVINKPQGVPEAQATVNTNQSSPPLQWIDAAASHATVQNSQPTNKQMHTPSSSNSRLNTEPRLLSNQQSLPNNMNKGSSRRGHIDYISSPTVNPISQQDKTIKGIPVQNPIHRNSNQRPSFSSRIDPSSIHTVNQHIQRVSKLSELDRILNGNQHTQTINKPQGVPLTHNTLNAFTAISPEAQATVNTKQASSPLTWIDPAAQHPTMQNPQPANKQMLTPSPSNSRLNTEPRLLSNQQILLNNMNQGSSRRGQIDYIPSSAANPNSQQDKTINGSPVQKSVLRNSNQRASFSSQIDSSSIHTVNQHSQSVSHPYVLDNIVNNRFSMKQLQKPSKTNVPIDNHQRNFNAFIPAENYIQNDPSRQTVGLEPSELPREATKQGNVPNGVRQRHVNSFNPLTNNIQIPPRQAEGTGTMMSRQSTSQANTQIDNHQGHFDSFNPSPNDFQISPEQITSPPPPPNEVLLMNDINSVSHQTTETTTQRQVTVTPKKSSPLAHQNNEKRHHFKRVLRPRLSRPTNVFSAFGKGGNHQFSMQRKPSYSGKTISSSAISNTIEKPLQSPEMHFALDPSVQVTRISNNSGSSIAQDQGITPQPTTTDATTISTLSFTLQSNHSNNESVGEQQTYSEFQLNSTTQTPNDTLVYLNNQTDPAAEVTASHTDSMTTTAASTNMKSNDAIKWFVQQLETGAFKANYKDLWNLLSAAIVNQRKDSILKDPSNPSAIHDINELNSKLDNIGKRLKLSITTKPYMSTPPVPVDYQQNSFSEIKVHRLSESGSRIIEPAYSAYVEQEVKQQRLEKSRGSLFSNSGYVRSDPGQEQTLNSISSVQGLDRGMSGSVSLSNPLSGTSSPDMINVKDAVLMNIEPKPYQVKHTDAWKPSTPSIIDTYQQGQSLSSFGEQIIPKIILQNGNEQMIPNINTQNGNEWQQLHFIDNPNGVNIAPMPHQAAVLSAGLVNSNIPEPQTHGTSSLNWNQQHVPQTIDKMPHQASAPSTGLVNSNIPEPQTHGASSLNWNQQHVPQSIGEMPHQAAAPSAGLVNSNIPEPQSHGTSSLNWNQQHVAQSIDKMPHQAAAPSTGLVNSNIPEPQSHGASSLNWNQQHVPQGIGEMHHQAAAPSAGLVNSNIPEPQTHGTSSLNWNQQHVPQSIDKMPHQASAPSAGLVNSNIPEPQTHGTSSLNWNQQHVPQSIDKMPHQASAPSAGIVNSNIPEPQTHGTSSLNWNQQSVSQNIGKMQSKQTYVAEAIPQTTETFTTQLPTTLYHRLQYQDPKPKQAQLPGEQRQPVFSSRHSMKFGNSRVHPARFSAMSHFSAKSGAAATNTFRNVYSIEPPQMSPHSQTSWTNSKQQVNKEQRPIAGPTNQQSYLDRTLGVTLKPEISNALPVASNQVQHTRSSTSQQQHINPLQPTHIVHNEPTFKLLSHEQQANQPFSNPLSRNNVRNGNHIQNPEPSQHSGLGSSGMHPVSQTHVQNIHQNPNSIPQQNHQRRLGSTGLHSVPQTNTQNGFHQTPNSVSRQNQQMQSIHKINRQPISHTPSNVDLLPNAQRAHLPQRHNGNFKISKLFEASIGSQRSWHNRNPNAAPVEQTTKSPFRRFGPASQSQFQNPVQTQQQSQHQQAPPSPPFRYPQRHPPLHQRHVPLRRQPPPPTTTTPMPPSPYEVQYTREKPNSRKSSTMAGYGPMLWVG